jgi:hypothetical protein
MLIITIIILRRILPLNSGLQIFLPNVNIRKQNYTVLQPRTVGIIRTSINSQWYRRQMYKTDIGLPVPCNLNYNILTSSTCYQLGPLAFTHPEITSETANLTDDWQKFDGGSAYYKAYIQTRKHNTEETNIPMHEVGFEPAIPLFEQWKTVVSSYNVHEDNVWNYINLSEHIWKLKLICRICVSHSGAYEEFCLLEYKDA